MTSARVVADAVVCVLAVTAGAFASSTLGWWCVPIALALALVSDLVLQGTLTRAHKLGAVGARTRELW